jgi:hypothetical protein
MKDQRSLLLPIALTIVISAVLFGSLGYNLAINNPSSSETDTSLTASTALTKTISTVSDFSGKSQTYSVSYPADWKGKINSLDSRSIDISFTLEGKEYGISFAMGGRDLKGDQISETKTTYGSKSFTRRVGTTNNSIVEIAYIPDESAMLFESAVANPPVEDNAKYVAEFDKIMMSLEVVSN